MFMGAQGVGPLGVMEGDPLLIQAEQKLINQADELVLLVDSSKFAQTLQPDPVPARARRTPSSPTTASRDREAKMRRAARASASSSPRKPATAGRRHHRRHEARRRTAGNAA